MEKDKTDETTLAEGLGMVAADGFAEDETPSGEALKETPVRPDEKPAGNQAGKGEPVKEDFQPFYRKEAKAEAWSHGVSSALNWVLLAGLGLVLIGLTVETYLQGLPFRLEATTAAVIFTALIGFLWKHTTLQSKAGLAALAVSAVLFIAYVLYGRADLGLWGLPGSFILMGFFALSLAAALLTVWLLWPSLTWPPLVLTALLLYAVLAPVFGFIQETPDFNGFLTGPGFMSGWPAFLRPGWFMAQAALPLGVVLLILIQTRTLTRKKYQTHWGFIYWALALALTMVIGLIGLERNQMPVFPALDSTLAGISHIAPETAAVEVAAQPESGPVLPLEQPAPPEQPSAPAPEDQAAGTEPLAPEPIAPPAVMAEPSAPETAVAKPVEAAEVEALRSRIGELETELGELRRRLDVQETMIRSLLKFLGTSERPGQPPASENQLSPSPPTQPEQPPQVEEGSPGGAEELPAPVPGSYT